MNNNETNILNKLLQDKQLDLSTRGLYCFLKSQPNGEFSGGIVKLCHATNTGYRRIRECLNELKANHDIAIVYRRFSNKTGQTKEVYITLK